LEAVVWHPELSFGAMSKPLEEDLSILAGAKHGLTYLTPNDWALVADKAVRVQFKKGQTIINRGKRPNGIYLLLKGTARVQIPPQTAFPTVGPGEICGEMSFLEEGVASADVVAEEAVEAFHLDHSTVQRLFELFPHLGSRFYRSLAINLSRRLREMITTKPRD
jgi:CRP-like cAMP-binding protein